MKKLRGRTAIVTGASRGIGPYVARALAEEGMNLVLAARSVEALEQVAVEVGRQGVKAIATPTDVADAASRRALVEAAVGEFGAIDVLVNNAGIEQAKPYGEMAEEDIRDIVEVNLLASMFLTQAVLAGMQERGRGHIVNMASLAGKMGLPYATAYSASKAGMIGMTKALRAELHGSGVSASVICPGFVAEAGMYADGMVELGVNAPRMTGTSPPAKVARAVVKAIKSDKPEIIVNPRAVRVPLTIAEASPTLGEMMARRTGVVGMMREVAKRRAAGS